MKSSQTPPEPWMLGKCNERIHKCIFVMIFAIPRAVDSQFLEHTFEKQQQKII